MAEKVATIRMEVGLIKAAQTLARQGRTSLNKMVVCLLIDAIRVCPEALQELQGALGEDWLEFCKAKYDYKEQAEGAPATACPLVRSGVVKLEPPPGSNPKTGHADDGVLAGGGA